MNYDRMVVAESSLDGAESSCNPTQAGSSPLSAASFRGERMDKPTIVVHAYPVYVDDWRGSETRMETTLEQRMLLWELIFYCFKEGSLPTDPAKLRKIADCSEKEWARAWPAITHKFEERGGRLHHARVDAEMARISESKEKAARSGAAGARKRWGAYSNPIATPQKRNSEQAMVPQCDSMASNPTPIPIQSNPTAMPSQNDWNGWDPESGFQAFLAAYPVHRRNQSRLAQGYYIEATGGTQEKHDRLMALLERCKASEQWAKESGQYVTGIAKFLQEPPWHILDAPVDPPMRYETLEEIQARVLAR